MIVCSEAAADESLAAIRARSRLGIAMAAMIRMMATTISSSISEKPFCFRISIFPQAYFRFLNSLLATNDSVGLDVCICLAKIRVIFVTWIRRETPLLSDAQRTFVTSQFLYLAKVRRAA